MTGADDALFDEREYLDAVRLAATPAGHAILDTLVNSHAEAGTDDCVTMDVFADAAPNGTDIADRVKALKRAALIVERRGPDTDSYFAVTEPGRTA